MGGGGAGVLVLLAAVLPLARGSSESLDATSPFYYDWHQLRVGGLVVAAVLCVTGIVVLLSGKCKCRSKASRHRPPPETSHLVGPGAASSC